MPDLMLAGILFTLIALLAGAEWHDARRQRRHDRMVARILEE